ncbi:MAG: hypothetical protein NTV70_26365 [Acidobacteria bacterium]|nr:hypothetical protein [Acidobacteriota bacterium]
MKPFDDQDFEKELSQALARVTPPEGFEGRVQRRVRLAGRAIPARPGSGGLFSGWRLQWAAALAVVVLVAGGTWSYQERERRRGELARDRTLAALRLTSEKLQLAKSRIHRVNQGDMQ